MDAKVFNWDTEFETSKMLMIHTFSDRVKVVTDLKNCTIAKFKDGNMIQRTDCRTMTLSQYERYLVEVAESAETLKVFSND